MLAESLVNKLAESLVNKLAESLVNKLAKSLVNMLTESMVNTLAGSLVSKLAESLVNMLPKSLVNLLAKSLVNHSVLWGITQPPPPPRSKTPLPLFRQAPSLKYANCPRPPFLGNSPPYILVFREPPQKSDFSVNPHNIKIFHP